MRVLTYNIHSGVGTDQVQDYWRIGQLLKARKIDIALLQEMDTRDGARDSAQDVQDICSDHFSCLTASPAITEPQGWYGNAILTRYPVISSKTVDVSQQGFQPRNIQEVVVRTERGPLRLINTHKGLKKQERRKQFALLDEYIHQCMAASSTPIIVGGDFNEWQFLTRAFTRLNKVLTQHQVGATFPTAWPLFRLDRLWTSADLVVKNVQVLKTAHTKYYSDHYPILVEIAL